MGSSHSLPASVNCKDIKKVLKRLVSTNLKVAKSHRSNENITTRMASGLCAELSEYLESSIDLDSFCAEYINNTLDKPLLLWIDGLTEFNPMDRSMSMCHSCLLVVGYSYLALFNLGGDNITYTIEITRPSLTKYIIQKIRRTRIMGAVRNQKAWHKAGTPPSRDGNIDCLKETIDLTQKPTRKEYLSGLNYTLSQ
jgi:hypothetical protein